MSLLPQRGAFVSVEEEVAHSSGINSSAQHVP